MPKLIIGFVVFIVITGFGIWYMSQSNPVGQAVPTLTPTEERIFNEVSAKQEESRLTGNYVQVFRGGIYPDDVKERIADVPDNVQINVRHGGKDGDGYQIILYEKNSTISKGYGSLASETWEIKASSTP